MLDKEWFCTNKLWHLNFLAPTFWNWRFFWPQNSPWMSCPMFMLMESSICNMQVSFHCYHVSYTCKGYGFPYSSISQTGIFVFSFDDVLAYKWQVCLSNKFCHWIRFFNTFFLRRNTIRHITSSKWILYGVTLLAIIS